MEGRVEVLYNGVWWTVCDDGWDLNDATVVCRMLGYGRALGAPGRAYFGEGSGEILLDDVSCVGTEDNLATCYHSDFRNHDCGHNEDAGVICGQSNLSGKTLFSDDLSDPNDPIISEHSRFITYCIVIILEIYM